MKMLCWVWFHRWEHWCVVFERRKCSRCGKQQIFGFGQWHTEKLTSGNSER